MNKQFPLWGFDNPGNKLINESPRSVLKVTGKKAIGWNGIIGPYFFENDDGKTVTVHLMKYRTFQSKTK